jgi:signal peptidase
VEVVTRDGELYFRTKGDANEEPDSNPIPAENVVGKVWFGIPYIGYVTTLAGGQTAQLALVVVPAVLLVLNEVWTLARATRTTGDVEADPSPESE